MVDRKKIKQFWDARAQTFDSLPFESIANLEQDPENLQLKIQLETEKVFGWLSHIADQSILDLGAGVGQWSFRFIERGAKSVTAVEYSAALAEIGRKEALKRGISNLEFIVSPAEDFVSTRPYDIVYISGLFVYMDDGQAAKLMTNLSNTLHPGTIVLLRDGTGIEGRHEINDKMSGHLKTNYSAVYRTRDDYINMFQEVGLKLVKDENMFDEDCSLNKYPETRLRVYLFRLGSSDAKN